MQFIYLLLFFILQMPYCTLMDGLSKAGHLDEARAIFRELQEKRVKSGTFPIRQ